MSSAATKKGSGASGTGGPSLLMGAIFSVIAVAVLEATLALVTKFLQRIF